MRRIKCIVIISRNLLFGRIIMILFIIYILFIQLIQKLKHRGISKLLPSVIWTYLITISFHVVIIQWIKEKYDGFKMLANVFINSVYFGKVDFFLQLNIQQCTSSSAGNFDISCVRIHAVTEDQEFQMGQWFLNSKTSGFVFIVISILFFVLIWGWVRTFWFTSFWSRPLAVATFRFRARCLRQQDNECTITHRFDAV